MALLDPFQYVANIRSLQGELLGQLPLAPDFDPLLQWATFQGIRSGRVRPVMRGSSGIVRPTWDHEFGQPRVAALSITLPCDGPTGPAGASNTKTRESSSGVDTGDDELTLIVPRGYLKRSVERAASQLVEEGKLGDGEQFLYDLCAFPRAAPTPAAGASVRPGPVLEDVEQELRLDSASLKDQLRGARPRSESHWNEDDMPLFLPEHVLSEAKEFSRRTPDIESGGVLLGRLYRDTEGPEVFSVITAFVPARHTVAERARLTFTSDTWAAADAALALRGGDELWAGWIHHHPDFCSGCPPERQRNCVLRTPFFSADDVNLHRAVFPGGYTVAVLLSDLGGDDLVTSVFASRYGLISERGYYLLDGSPVVGDSSAPSADAPHINASPAAEQTGEAVPARAIHGEGDAAPEGCPGAGHDLDPGT